MKKLVFLLLLFAVPFSAKASCTYNDKVRLQKLAGNVNFAYRYKDTTYSVIFEITVSNLMNEIYMIDTSSGRRYESNNKDITIPNYEAGSIIRFDFYAKDSSCTEGVLFSNYVTLPSFNPYYNSEICKGIEDFKLCQKWLKHDMTYKEFYEGVTEYLNVREDPIKEPSVSKTEFDWESVIQFWADYYIYILLAIIIVGGVILYLHDKKTDL